MSELIGNHWYAVQTKSHFERSLAAELQLKSISSFGPGLEEMHPWADRKKTIMQPYVFANFHNQRESKVALLNCSGAVRILGTQNGIEAIRIAVGFYKCFRHVGLEEGTWVKVARGPFKSVEGRFVRVKNEARLVLATSMLSKCVAAETDLRDVEVVQVGKLAVKSQPVGRVS